MISVDTNQ